MAAASSRNVLTVKAAVDGAFAAREPALRAKLHQALGDLDSKYREIRSKYFPCVREGAGQAGASTAPGAKLFADRREVTR